MRYSVIMAGGSGTRLWPMSTSDIPKQLIPFIKGKSLLQIAVGRQKGLVEDQNRFICTGANWQEPINALMPDFSNEQLFFEPTGRDTLNAVGFPAAIFAKTDPNAAMAVFTADHLIEPVDQFIANVNTGFEIVEKNPNTLVTFGIQPDYPATGFGYVEKADAIEGFDGGYNVAQFVEKPDESTAKSYLESGKFLWNSGMFVWNVTTILECIKRYEPAAYDGLMEIADAWGTDKQDEVLNAVYPELPKNSIDFAIMEKASEDAEVNIACVEMPVKWTDVGSWPAYGETLEADSFGNRIAADKVQLVDCHNTLVVNGDKGHLIAAMGLQDVIVIHTDTSTLICHNELAQEIKKMHQLVKENFGEDYI